MANDFGSGVSRTLDAVSRQFSTVVWQKNKPPLDSELNLMSQVDWANLQQMVQSMMPSGFILDPTRPTQDFETDQQWANLFKFGVPPVPRGSHEQYRQTPVVWANVNGWIIPVAGTDSDGTSAGDWDDLANLIKLYPPPESDSRIDLVFLEAWQTVVHGNPSTTNKPAADKLWKYGNVQYGGTNLDDDLEDPEIRFETTARVQVQYRLRVHGSGVGLGGSVALDVHPDGLGDPNVFGQGTATTPQSGSRFTNMGRELGDPSLWRAGDGDPNNAFGTIDGYVYAIPVCAVFRRNSNVYVAVNQSGNPNQNGAFERTPNSKLLPDPLAGATELTQPILGEFLSPTAATTGTDAVVQVSNLNGSGLDDPSLTLTSTFIVIDDEILSISAVDIVNGTITIPLVADATTGRNGRGRNGTAATGHQAGASVSFFNTRPDSLFSDEVAEADILDLRRAVNAQEWDYIRLLEHNLGALTRGKLRSTWKKSGEGDSQGPVVQEVDYLYADGATAVPNHTEAMDGPDGIRTIFSDAATIQPDVTLLLDNDATQDANHYVGFTNDPLDDTVEWDVGPDFKPSAFMNVGPGDLVADNVWTNGSLIFLYTGGSDGTQGARSTFRDGSTRAVRPLMPKEYWKDNERLPATGRQTPVTARFVGERAFDPYPPTTPVTPTDLRLCHPGPMYPWYQLFFDWPIVVLGAPLRDSLIIQNVPVSDYGGGGGTLEIDLGVDFDTDGVFFHKENGRFANDPTQISAPLLRGSRTLWGMITDNGNDITGFSSEVYLVAHGDPDNRTNNGVFKVIGAGTAGYTVNNAANSTSVLLFALNADINGADWGTGTNSVTLEFRSPYSNSDDASDYAAKAADIVIGLTDIGGTILGSFSLGTALYPWAAVTLDQSVAANYDTSMPRDSLEDIAAVPSKLLLNMSLLYHPGRGAMARVPDDINRFAMKFGTTETLGAYLRQSGTAIDNVFSAPSGVPSDETYFDVIHVQTWNRLPSLGLTAPVAPDYGGAVVGFTEQDREHEAFIDRGSKTLLFRPFRDREMTLQAQSFTDLLTTDCLLGTYGYTAVAGVPPKDALQIWTGTAPNIATTGKQMGFALPPEFMPRFGRQDIPAWLRISDNDPFLPGINHLFVDSADWNRTVFNIIGGETNHGVGLEVNGFYLSTLDPAKYAISDTLLDPTNNRPMLGARKTSDITAPSVQAQQIIAALKAVNSSDLGKGLKGIQLPPYYGIARLYGVYDSRDYASKGGRTWKANRYEEESDPAPNLLRMDVDQQTLFILEDGAVDLTLEEGDHTYIIPSNVLDLTRALNYAVGDEFEDYEYIVECAVFGFAKNWINENNFVMVRKFDGQGHENVDSDMTVTPPDPAPPQLEGIHMVIPCPAGFNDQFYMAYDRTVYQGDPYMTRSGDVKTDSDYEHRYGQISMSNQFALQTVIQQYDSAGDFVPQTPNVRGFEILASMDFYTTLGTGKVGGELYPGTSLDVCFTEQAACHRAPHEATQPAWRVLPRAYTQGQQDNPTRADLGVQVLDASNMNPDPLVHATLTIGHEDSSTVIYATTEANKAGLMVSLTVAGISYHDPESFWIVDANTTRLQSGTPDTFSGETIRPGEFVDILLTRPTSDFDLVSAVLEDLVGTHTDYLAWFPYSVSGGNYQLRILNTWTPAAYDIPGGGSTPVPAMVQGFTVTLPATGANASAQVTPNVNWTPGGTLLPTDQFVVTHVDVPTEGVLYTAHYVDANSIVLYVHNITTAPIVPATHDRDIQVAMFREQDLANYTATGVGGSILTRWSETAWNTSEAALGLVNTINDHPDVRGTAWAYALGQTAQIQSLLPGDQGNNDWVVLGIYNDSGSHTIHPYQAWMLNLEPPQVVLGSVRPFEANLSGGLFIPANAGDGTSQVNLTGMIERLPLGALLQDSDFLCENPLNDTASAMRTGPVGPRPIQTVMPLTEGGEEYTRFLGSPGDLVALADGSVSVLNYTAWTDTTPTGSRIFRLYRGGGSVFVLNGDAPGGPLDWTSESFPSSFRPVLKGGVLACRAMLVRNFYEEANPAGGPYKVSDGDEIQMVIVTQGLFGCENVQQNGLNLNGVCSPSGYGEGYSAADRYRIDGKPMLRGFTQSHPNPAAVQLAVHPDEREDFE